MLLFSTYSAGRDMSLIGCAVESKSSTAQAGLGGWLKP
jgi:hypothetical protein